MELWYSGYMFFYNLAFYEQTQLLLTGNIILYNLMKPRHKCSPFPLWCFLQVPIQERVGEAITLNLGLMETISRLSVDASMELCTTSGGSTSCTNHTLVDDALLHDPQSSCGVGKKRKRRSTK